MDFKQFAQINSWQLWVHPHHPVLSDLCSVSEGLRNISETWEVIVSNDIVIITGSKAHIGKITEHLK